MKLGIKIFISIGVLVVVFGLPLILGTEERQAFELSPVEGLKLSLFEHKGLYMMHHLMAFIPVFYFGICLGMANYRTQSLRYMAATLIVAPIYLIWDACFNQWGIWGFNDRYITGFRIGGLPWEEWVWFFIIPFCSFFVHTHVRENIRLNTKWDSWLVWIILPILLIIYANTWEKMYSAWSVGSVIVILVWILIWKREGIGIFMISFGINCIPMFFFNGMLTGLLTEQGLVVYHPGEFSGIRVGSYPVEDLGFGFSYLFGIYWVKQKLSDRFADNYEA